MSRETIYAEVRLNQQLRQMENESSFGWPLMIGFITATLLILAGGPTMLVLSSYMDHSANKAKSLQASFSEKEMEKQRELTPEEQEQMLKLGIEDGTEKSTMTWIGYKDYQEQFARKSEVEQAAFRETDSGGRPTQSQPNQPSPTAAQSQAQAQSAPPTPPTQNPPGPTAVAQAAVAPSPTAPAQPTPESQAPQTTQAVPTPPMPTSLALPETPKVAKPAEMVPLADERKIENQILPVEKVGDSKDSKVPPEPLKADPPPQPDAKPTDLKPNDLKPNEAKPTDAKPIDEKPPEKPADVKPTPEKPQEKKPPPKPDAAKPVEQPPTPQQPQAATSPPAQTSPGQTQPAANPPANPSQQTPATQPGTKPGPDSNGEVSDRESEASSTIDVPPAKWRNGRPLAAKGLNVRTQRPVFDELTSVSTAPANPIIEIEFDREGVPKKCTIIQSSGTSLIDQPIIDCLYRWRASGSELSKLTGDNTLKYRIRMLLR